VQPAKFAHHIDDADPATSDEPEREAAADPDGVTEELGAPAGSLALHPPVFVAPDASAGDAARAMRAAGMGAVLVGSEAPGIVTDRDLRNRVVADELPAATAVASIMSRPLKTLPVDAPVHEVLQLMLEEDIHHVPLTHSGRVIGIVTDKDLLRRQAKGPLLLLERIKALRSDLDLDGYTSELATTADALVAAGMDPMSIARVITSLNGALTRKLLRLAEDELGSPPCPYAWLALGSEGRMEQVLATDQDNALVYRDDTPQAREYFATLADRVVSALLRAGFPPCPRS
jgi:CBS domain-containing protein